MITHNLQQGTSEWHDFRANHFTASDASAMLGTSKYKTRNDLLREKTTGEKEVISKSKQAIFDKGHAAEERTRPIIEEQIGEELYPVVATSEQRPMIAASFDGITMLEDIIWENKMFNQELADYINEHNDLPNTHWPQVEQQLYVSGADKCIFTTSDGNDDERHAQLEYTSLPERINQVLYGWTQFTVDMETYIDTPKKETIKGEMVLALPEPTFSLDKNNLTVTSNLSVFKEAAHQLVEKAKQPLNTEQDFANAENMVKEFKRSEGKLEDLRNAVMADIDDVSVFISDVDEIKELIRQARLTTDKQVKTRKEEIKRDIVSTAEVELKKLVLSNGSRLNVAFEFDADFAGAIKGKRNLDAIQDSVDTVLANAKIQIQNQVKLVEENLAYLNEQEQYKFLFNDWSMIAHKPFEDFVNLVDSRITSHKAEEEKRIQAEAERLAKEEAERKAKEITEQQAKAEESQQEPVVQDQAATLRAQRLNQGQQIINEVQSSPVAEFKPKQEDTITISRKEYQHLLSRIEKLEALEAAGVDNWAGYSEAMEMLKAS